jgi:hypothetical protein
MVWVTLQAFAALNKLWKSTKIKIKDQMQNILQQCPEYTTIWKWMLEYDPNNGQTVRHVSSQIPQKDQRDILA